MCRTAMAVRRRRVGLAAPGPLRPDRTCSQAPRAPSRGGGRAFPQVARTARLADLLTVAAVSLVTVLGAVGTLVELVLAATHPLLLEWIGRVGPLLGLAKWQGDLSRVSDEALCRAWRRSGAVLAGAASVAVGAALVREREEYLDKLIRRHPHLPTTWYATGSP
jgi:hypothetical protein